MSRKRGRNKYPKLPEAVANLLALHGLRGVPVKERWAGGAFRGWVIKVVPDRPCPQPQKDGLRVRELMGFDHPIAGWYPIFEGLSGDSLEKWMQRVESWDKSPRTRDIYAIDFETYSNADVKAGRSGYGYGGLRYTKLWIDESGEINARTLQGADLLKKP